MSDKLDLMSLADLQRLEKELDETLIDAMRYEDDSQVRMIAAQIRRVQVRIANILEHRA